MEDLAYRRLLDQYYLRESALPADIQVTAKLVRMRSFAADVEAVLNEFFTLTDSGWMHNRCESEIERMQDKQTKARASAQASVNARKAKSLNVRSTDANESGNERSTVAQEKQADVELPTPTPTPTPTPVSVNTKASAVAAPDGVDLSVWTDFVQLRKDRKAKLTQTALDGISAEAAKAGWQLEAVLRECVSRGWTGFKAVWVADRQAHAQPAKQAKSFEQINREAGIEKWERLTGRTHPDRIQTANPVQHMGDVIETTSQVLEIAK
jgi:uncharacterized protein YdaU (DUF1376 family)